MTKGIISSVLKGGLHLMGVKELLETFGGILEKNKDIVLAVLDRKVLRLRDETLTMKATDRVSSDQSRKKLSSFYNHLRTNPELKGHHVALQLIIYSLVIFEEHGVPLVKQPRNATDCPPIKSKKLSKLDYTEATAFLEKIAGLIRGYQNSYDFSDAMEYLMDYRFIGQFDKTFLMNLLGYGQLAIKKLAGKNIKNALAREFPRELPPEGITPVLTKVHADLRRLKRRILTLGILR